MASAFSRGQIVSDVLSLAGRSSELRASVNQWLEYGLRHVGMTFRFPELRKIGSPVTLAQGSQTASLPTDFGAGMEDQGLLFGPANAPLDEMSFVEFTGRGGFPPAGSGTGQPRSYLVDRNAGVFRFNSVADLAYSFTPVYYALPPTLDVSSSYDNQKLWLDNDLLIVEIGIWFVYKFTGDDREDRQEAKVLRMINDWKREVVKSGGTSRLQLAPSRFRTVRFGSGYGP